MRSPLQLTSLALVALALAAAPGPAAGQTTAFTAATRAIFLEDLSSTTVGSFPTRLQLEKGTVEVVEAEGRRFLRATSEFQLRIPLDERLPQSFTFEMEMRGSGTTYYDGMVKIDFGKGETADHVVCSPFEAGIYGRGGFERKAITDLKELAKEWDLNGATFRCRMIIEGPSTKVFVEDRLVASSLVSDLGRQNYITLSSGRASAENPILITNLRVMAFSEARIATVSDAEAQALAREAPTCAASGAMGLGMCPLEGPPGTVVSLVAKNLSGVVELGFGSLRYLPFTVINDEHVAFRVPAIPASIERDAPVYVRTRTGLGRYPTTGDGRMQPFRRLPRVDSIRPLRATRGDTLTLFGADLHLIGAMHLQPAQGVAAGRASSTLQLQDPERRRATIVVGDAASGELRWEERGSGQRYPLPFRLEVVAPAAPPPPARPATPKPPKRPPVEEECGRGRGERNRRCK